MKMSLRNLAWSAALAVLALMFLLVSPHAARQGSLLDTYGPLVEIDALVRRHFVETVSADRLREGALAGVMRMLDPYSGYLSPEAYAAYQRRLAGQDVGIGIELGMVFGRPTVIAPVEGEPAADAGVEAGDVILAVDGVGLDGLSATAVDGLLGGPPNSTVELALYRPEHAQTITARVTRRPEAASFVRGFAGSADHWVWMLDPDAQIGYVRIAAFRSTTQADFDAALGQLHNQGMRGLIIDLRYNPGGLVAEACAIVDRFVDEGSILRTITRTGAEEIYRATHEGTDLTTRLAVLINGSSASAAEIVSGSLQDHGRATIIGSRSFGKASVQYILPLADGQSAIRLTAAYYALPKGRIVHKTPNSLALGTWGVLPDLKVDLDADAERRIRGSLRRAGDTPAELARDVLTADAQIQAALDLLRRKLAGQPSAS